MQNWQPGDRPVVSICCATFNHEPYIAKAIEGFLMQETDFPFEIVIRDDCSTDHTADIVRRYAERYPHIIRTFFEEENTYSKGVKAMQAIFKLARGEYIAICEGDDYWTDPLKIQKQVDFLSRHDDYVLTYTAAEAFDENGVVENYSGGVRRDVEAIELQKTIPINTLTTCFRNVIRDFPPEFGGTRFGDLFLWSLLGAYGKGKFLEDIRPARYRMHEGGVFSKQSVAEKQKMAYLTRMALYMYYYRLDNKELSDYFHKNVINFSLRYYGALYYIKIVVKHILSRNKFIKELLALRKRDNAE